MECHGRSWQPLQSILAMIAAARCHSQVAPLRPLFQSCPLFLKLGLYSWFLDWTLDPRDTFYHPNHAHGVGSSWTSSSRCMCVTLLFQLLWKLALPLTFVSKKHRTSSTFCGILFALRSFESETPNEKWLGCRNLQHCTTVGNVPVPDVCTCIHIHLHMISVTKK